MSWVRQAFAHGGPAGRRRRSRGGRAGSCVFGWRLGSPARRSLLLARASACRSRPLPHTHTPSLSQSPSSTLPFSSPNRLKQQPPPTLHSFSYDPPSPTPLSASSSNTLRARRVLPLARSRAPLLARASPTVLLLLLPPAMRRPASSPVSSAFLLGSLLLLSTSAPAGPSPSRPAAPRCCSVRQRARAEPYLAFLSCSPSLPAASPPATPATFASSTLMAMHIALGPAADGSKTTHAARMGTLLDLGPDVCRPSCDEWAGIETVKSSSRPYRPLLDAR